MENTKKYNDGTTRYPVRVIFRKFKDGELIALMPEEPGDNDSNNCLSYMTIGQHGTASERVTTVTKPAKSAEYQDLLTELTRLGYEVHPCSKFTKTARDIRYKKIHKPA